MVENGAGKMSFSRRGDFVRGMDGDLLNGVGQKILDTSLIPIKVPPFQKIFVSEAGQVYIQPVGAEPNTRILINQIALNSGDEEEIIKDISEGQNYFKKTSKPKKSKKNTLKDNFKNTFVPPEPVGMKAREVDKTLNGFDVVEDNKTEKKPDPQISLKPTMKLRF